VGVKAYGRIEEVKPFCRDRILAFEKCLLSAEQHGCPYGTHLRCTPLKVFVFIDGAYETLDRCRQGSDIFDIYPQTTEMTLPTDDRNADILGMRDAAHYGVGPLGATIRIRCYGMVEDP
jgi:hypothetical protein